jgi:hypothetical protein
MLWCGVVWCDCAGVIQIESIFYDTAAGLMPSKERALQHSYPVLVMESLRGGDLLHRIDARARGGHAVSERYLAATFRSAMLALQGIHKRGFIHSKDTQKASMPHLLLVSLLYASPSLTVLLRAIQCKPATVLAILIPLTSRTGMTTIYRGY